MMVLLRFNIYNELHVTSHLRILGGRGGYAIENIETLSSISFVSKSLSKSYSVLRCQCSMAKIKIWNVTEVIYNNSNQLSSLFNQVKEVCGQIIS